MECIINWSFHSCRIGHKKWSQTTSNVTSNWQVTDFLCQLMVLFCSIVGLNDSGFLKCCVRTLSTTRSTQYSIDYMVQQTCNYFTHSCLTSSLVHHHNQLHTLPFSVSCDYNHCFNSFSRGTCILISKLACSLCWLAFEMRDPARIL